MQVDGIGSVATLTAKTSWLMFVCLQVRPIHRSGESGSSPASELIARL